MVPFTNPAHILWLIRQGQASDWQSLCHSVGIDPDDRYTHFAMLMGSLRSLLHAGLITTNVPLDYETVKNLTFAVTPSIDHSTCLGSKSVSARGN